MNNKQLLVAITTVIIVFVLLIVPITESYKTMYAVVIRTNWILKIGLMSAISIIGIILTVYFKDKK